MTILISSLLIIPLAGAILSYLLKERLSQAVALIAAVLVLAMVAGSALFGGLPQQIDSATAGYIPAINVPISFSLGGISLVLSLMVSIVGFAAVLAGNHRRSQVRQANFLALMLEFSALGLFMAVNLFIFFIFWDIGVAVSFFMIYALGSGDNRRAALKFLVYSIAASSLLLAAMIALYVYVPSHSLDYSSISAASGSLPHLIDIGVIAALFVAFMIKMPVFPFHSWMADAYSSASTQGSMMISGILSKFGAYGMLTMFMLMAPSSTVAQYALFIAGISAFYAAFVGMRQLNVKRMAAYTSMAELGIILVGISSMSSLGYAGALYGMLAHGISISLLFLALGALEYMYGDINANMLKGILRDAAATGYTLVVSVFATLGLPLTAGFIADILIFMGATRTFGLAGLIPLGALILVGAYLFVFINRIFPSDGRLRASQHPSAANLIGYGALLFATFALGILPFVLLNAITL
ncbi:MAG: NADH-quinone oxidoreductase subunit M [Candidatus Micrarchaeota archaeon]|nr:NADH-quinone oxidoreductase subunit M [Candidatus Micrarchaeota archaeon]